MQLISGVLMALAVTVLLLIIPVVHFVSGPIGPFVGGFIGIGRWEKRPESALAAGFAFGMVLWLLLAAIAAIVIIVLASVTSMISGGTGALIIGAVVGGVFYITILATAGATISASRVKVETGGDG